MTLEGMDIVVKIAATLIAGAWAWFSTREFRHLKFGEAKIDAGDGHLSLKRLVTSGNLVPKQDTACNSLDKSSFFYIESGVEQTINFLCLIP